MADVVDRIAPAKAPPVSAKTDEELALDVLHRAIEDESAEGDSPEAAIAWLIQYLGIARFMEMDKDERALLCDEGEMEEALARARLGEMTDSAIHLSRGLPQKFAGIADALERHLERGR